MSSTRIQKNTAKSKGRIVDQSQGAMVLDVIKRILKTTWGMRIALGLSGVLLFFMGYLIGNWGTADLKARVEQKKEEINESILEKKKLTTKVHRLQKEVAELKRKLSYSQSKMLLLKQRNKIRKPLYDALELWKGGKKTETKVKLHAAIINLRTEAKSATGLSRWFYRTTIRKLQAAIKQIDTGCGKNTFWGEKETAKDCTAIIRQIIIRATEILPAP